MEMSDVQLSGEGEEPVKVEVRDIPGNHPSAKVANRIATRHPSAREEGERWWHFIGTHHVITGICMWRAGDPYTRPKRIFFLLSKLVFGLLVFGLWQYIERSTGMKLTDTSRITALAKSNLTAAVVSRQTAMAAGLYTGQLLATTILTTLYAVGVGYALKHMLRRNARTVALAALLAVQLVCAVVAIVFICVLVVETTKHANARNVGMFILSNYIPAMALSWITSVPLLGVEYYMAEKKRKRREQSGEEARTEDEIKRLKHAAGCRTRRPSLLPNLEEVIENGSDFRTTSTSHMARALSERVEKDDEKWRTRSTMHVIGSHGGSESSTGGDEAGVPSTPTKSLVDDDGFTLVTPARDAARDAACDAALERQESTVERTEGPGSDADV